MSSSQCHGLITLFHKGGERSNRSNWRPISFLNVDYKIASRFIALRLLKVIASVVSINQTCGVPGRQISDNTALIRDIVDYCSRSSSRAAIFLWATLHKMGSRRVKRCRFSISHFWSNCGGPSEIGV